MTRRTTTSGNGAPRALSVLLSPQCAKIAFADEVQIEDGRILTTIFLSEERIVQTPLFHFQVWEKQSQILSRLQNDFCPILFLSLLHSFHQSPNKFEVGSTRFRPDTPVVGCFTGHPSPLLPLAVGTFTHRSQSRGVPSSI